MSHEFDIWQQLTRIADSLEKIERKLPEQPILTANEMRETVGLELITSWSNVVNDMIHHPYVRYTHPNFSSDEYIYAKEDGRIFTEEGYLFEDWVSEGTYRHDGMRMRKDGSWEDGWMIYTGTEGEN